MKILHLSDYHTSSSIQEDVRYIQTGVRILYKLKQTLKTIKPDIVIFTGDLISMGKTNFLKNHSINSILKIFTDISIPVLFCPGNHEMDTKLIEKGKQFSKFVTFYKKFTTNLRKNGKNTDVSFSSKFKSDQISYIDLPNFNTLFVSLNSAENCAIKLSEKEIDEQKKSGTFKEEYVAAKNPSLMPQSCEPFFDKLKGSMGFDVYKKRNKFVICHHSLYDLERDPDAINILQNNDIKIVFSGDLHRKKEYVAGSIYGFVVGSLFASWSKTFDKSTAKYHPLQFNFYNIDLNHDRMQLDHYIFNNIGESDKMNRWIKKEQENIENISFYHQWNLIEWCKEFDQLMYLKRLESLEIYEIYEDSVFDFIALTNNGIRINLYIYDVESDFKMQEIESSIGRMKNDDEIKIIDKTKKLHELIDEYYILKL